jgi:hypothetical protein
MKKKSKSRRSGYTRLSKRGYVYKDGRTLTVIPLSTLRENPKTRKDIGITDEQWEAINQ